MGSVVIVDYGMSNLRSVQKAVERAAADAGLAWKAVITPDPEVVAAADKVIVPGQGAFRDCSIALRSGLAGAVRGQIERGTSFLGICMGMQTLFASSEEAPGYEGLSTFEGTNVRLADGQRDPRTGEIVKIPHMGWNRVSLVGAGHPILRSAGGEGTHFYFTHSYHAVPSDPSLVVAVAEHGPFRITAAVARGNVFATQFHPEKSQAAGLALLTAFLKS
ncbi:MAG TPA: imidazole glycerol phosphate synthase subunit HisH [Polyangiaceae bacterium]|nr:imidazole glycerol phosphate synthase subunit HisH [Polyangiaceae bacterium]